MKFTSDKLVALAVLCAVLMMNAVALWPELSISRVDVNDNVLHYTLVERIVAAVERGEAPLDCWSPEWSLGYPVLRTYQPLAHMLVAGAYFALGKAVPLMTVFVWVRFLALVLLPLSFYVSVRLMGLPALTAVASAILAPLVSTNFLYGMEFGSFIWAGTGLFPQAVATHLMLITLGVSFQAIRRGHHVVWSGVLLGLTCLAHMVYGYMAGLSVVALALMSGEGSTRAVRIRRAVVAGGSAGLLAAFQIVPLLKDGSVINHSRWERPWKWDSFGAGQVLTWLFTGELLDHGRWPILTALALSGAGLFLWNTRQRKRVCEAHQFALLGAGLWILMYFGRPFWGPLLVLLGVPADAHLHRLIGGAQIFLVLLAAIALAALWRELRGRWHVAVAIVAAVVLLYPMARERWTYIENNATWGRANLEAYAANRDALDTAVSFARQQGGRAYAGLAAGWGGRFKIGHAPFYAFLSEANVPAVAFLYHSMALTADTMVRFNEWNPAHYDLFNIHTVVAPAKPESPLPPFLVPRGQVGSLQMFEAPGTSYFSVVDVMAAVKTTRGNFYDVADRWLRSDWVARRSYLWFDWRGDAPLGLPRLGPRDELPAVAPHGAPGIVESERQDGETYRAMVQLARPGSVLFKMTWHPNWRAYVDGNAAGTAMLSPGFVGVAAGAGRHEVVLRYEPDSHKGWWALAGLFGTMLLLAGERRGMLARAETWIVPALPMALRWRLRTAGGLILLSLPVMIPLFTGSVLWGHDGFSYFPRLVEVHENVTHGILLPRWAPDLGRGTGQPLFLFHPPMIYYLGEFWHLLGWDVVTAMNLACAVVVLASAVCMFLLARLYFGAAGGWLGAAAYLYAPYFAVDLYVRSSMEEFAAFPFFALAMYGFGACAKYRSRGCWLLGVAAYALVLLCHFPAALLFTPLLLAFVAFTTWIERSREVLWRQAAGFALALGLSTFVWMPALDARQYASMERAVRGNGQYSNHFVYLHQLFYSPWGYGFSLPGPGDGMSFALGWSHLLLAIVAWAWIRRNPNVGDRRLPRFFGASAVVLSILMLQDAVWVWEQIPMLQNVQLPWRLLGPVSVCLAMLVAPLGKLLAAAPRWQRAGIAAALALLIVPSLAHLHPGRTTDVDLAFWTPERLARSGFETTTMGEATPRWMTALPPYTPLAVTVRSGDAEVERTVRAPFAWTSRVKAKAASTLEMSTAWFPGWEARVDGQAVEAGPGQGSGLLTFPVPAGEHVVEVVYGRTSREKQAMAVSVVALLLTVMLAWFRWPVRT